MGPSWSPRGLQLGRLPCSVLVRVTLVLTSGTVPSDVGRVFSGPGTQGPTAIPNNSEGSQAPAGLHLQPPDRVQLLPGPTQGPVWRVICWGRGQGTGPSRSPCLVPARSCSLLRKEGQDPSSSPEPERQ